MAVNVNVGSATNNRSPIISGTIAPVFTDGTASNYSLAQFVTDFENDTLAYSISAGTLPAGVTLTTAGVLQSSGGGTVGTTTGLRFAVTDGTNTETSPEFSIVVNPEVSFTVPTVQFTDGAGDATYDLRSLYVSEIPSGEVVSSIVVSAGTLPTGVTLDSDNERLVFTDANVTGPVTASGIEIVVSTTASVGSEADWTARSTEAGVINATNFSEFADRAALLTKAQTWEGDGSGVHYSFTGASFADPDRYNPVPNGTKEKVGLDPLESRTGGKSLRLRLYNSEGATESGPVIEFPFGDGQSTIRRTEYYFQFAVRFDEGYINHDFQGPGGGTYKLAFLNDLSFTGGQIVMTTQPVTGIVQAYRVHSTTTLYRLLTSGASPPSGIGSRNYYSFYDNDRGNATVPSTVSAWEQRFGYHRDNLDRNDADYANIPRFLPDTWYTVTAYVNVNYAGASSDGIVKIWASETGQAPELLVGGMIDANLGNAASNTSSVRLILRPEDATAAPPVSTPDGVGAWFDELILSDNPIQHPGGFDLPFPGTEIPTGYPPLGMSED